MRYFYTFMTISIMTASWARAQDVSKLDRDRGFVGVKLGSLIDDMPDAEVDSETDVDAWYVRPRQRLDWGGLKLRQIRYRVVEGRVAAIQLSPVDADSSKLLLKVLEKGFGDAVIRDLGGGAQAASWIARTVRLSWLHAPRNGTFGAEFVDVFLDQLAVEKALALSRQRKSEDDE